MGNGPVAQLYRAFDYGSKGCGLESRRGHKKLEIKYIRLVSNFCFYAEGESSTRRRDEGDRSKAGLTRHVVRQQSTLLSRNPHTKKNPHQNLFFSLIFKKDYYFCD